MSVERNHCLDEPFFREGREKREELNESIAEMSQTVVDLKRAFVETTPGVETSWTADLVDGIKESMRELTVGTSARDIAEAAEFQKASKTTFEISSRLRFYALFFFRCCLRGACFPFNKGSKLNF